MGSPAHLFRTGVGRALLGLSLLFVVFVLVGLGVLLSNTTGASHVAANARQLHWTNATLGAAGVTRAAIAQAVFFSFEGVANEPGKEIAVEEALRNLESTRGMVDSPDALDDPGLKSLVMDFVESGEAAVGLAGGGDGASGEVLRLTTVEPAFEALRETLTARQSRLAEQIAESEATAGRISRITFVAIAFMIPAVTMVGFLLALRRRMRIREAEMSARLKAERDLNRAKDELLAGLSHELRTPLTTIFGFSHILLDDPDLGSHSKELLGLINASSADLSRMVSDLLTAARIDADALTTRPERVDLPEQVAAVAEPYSRFGESIQVNVPAFQVAADPLHLRQILHNLISNAIRHGGKRVAVAATLEGEEVALMVADDGPGVPADLEGRLFERFVNAGREALTAGSVGLGLAISRELALRMGCDLAYQRVNGVTRFILRLPVAAAETAADPAPVSATELVAIP